MCETFFNFASNNQSLKSKVFTFKSKIMSKGFIHSSERSFYDENGVKQVETIEKQFSYKTDEDPFYMVFIDFVKWMYNITSVNSLKLLPKLLEIAKFNTGEITLSSGVRKQIEEDLNLSPATFTRALNDLIDNGAICKVYISKTDRTTGEIIKTELKGQYTVNPEMFWKGDLKKRKELRVTFTSIPED